MVSITVQIRRGRFVVFDTLGALIWSVAISAGRFLLGHAVEGVLKGIKRCEIEIIPSVITIGCLLWGMHNYQESKSG